jgi:pimeloyl-ACP methyl ester carboxylesterase
MCVYDRLGYGRSSKQIPNQSLKENLQITELMFSLLLKSKEKVIYGGWSAGVELSIGYSYYFPDRVDGLIFMDGYPDYLVL